MLGEKNNLQKHMNSMITFIKILKKEKLSYIVYGYIHNAIKILRHGRKNTG